MICRRAVASGLAASLLLARASPAFPQTAQKTFRVGYLSLFPPPMTGTAAAETYRELRMQLEAHGYVEGRNLVLEERYASGHIDRLPALASELAKANLDVIVAGPASAIRAAHDATTTTPIVMAFSAEDPVKSGFVRSLAHPGTNVTGVTAQASDIAPKWVELLSELVPTLRRVAVLANPAQPDHSAYLRIIESHLPPETQLVPVEAREATDYEAAFAAMTAAHAEALVILGSLSFTRDSGRLAELALSRRLPSVYLFREYAMAGGLLSYGPDHRDIFDLAAEYVDKILRGARPENLPVQQPTKFELVLNVKTAAVLGLKVPPTLVLRATEVVR